MADLPDKRCGVDMLGPYRIKERMSELKRYGALFTCFTCRVIHIKVTNALDINSFILALRRFLARRGALDPSGQTMEKILWEHRMNCRKDSRN